MNINAKRLQIVSLVVLAVVLLGIVSYILYEDFTFGIREKAISQLKSPQALERFNRAVGSIDDMNTGITLNLRPSSYQIRGQNRLDYDIWPINNTVEHITFPNNGFGVQVFIYDSDNNSWQEIELGVWPSTYPITIEPNSNVNQDYNYWILNSHLFKSVKRNQPVRVFVSGKGDTSGKRYGAYMDIWLYR